MPLRKKKYPLRGIVVSLNTPFDEAGRIDFPSVERLVEHHLRQGVVGFLTPAQAGEVLELSLQERIALVQHVLKLTTGRAILIAGATAANEDDTFALAEAAVAAGCDGVLVELPARIRTRQETVRFFESFAALGMRMLMIQDLDWTGKGLEVPLIVELFETIRAFRCLKVEVVPAGPKYSAVLEATGGRLHVSGGWAAEQMLEGLDRGVDAFIPTAMTGLYRRVFDASARGDLDEAAREFFKILPVLAFTRQHLEISIQFYKRLFHHCGIFSTFRTRKHAVPYDHFHEDYGRRLISYLGELDQEFRPGN